MAGVAKLFDGHILNKSNKEVDLYGKKYKGKIIGLYFSAHWCPPCRAFTPLLNELYNEYHKEKKFKIIFISCDNDEKSFNSYYKDMPWLTLDFNERKKKEELLKKFHVNGIPKLVLLDGDSGKIICTNATEQILYMDPEGKHFPWKSKK
ncbi:unnamed protein product [Rotaria sordida]|uniref:Thioredoxin domain-containing protein n=1 Tax=Rotaria sordida TaxID=392033 RepID=A0A814XNT0_9BILA|nr:unnamed protein product [Rotaria sordida]CAF1282500.1 unnamed protein product [Rotaria sordida]CAF3688197.1 unnamed protein product [Rotaria sordida]CAF3840412.1 unnamed protein product [Rotaria sordida]